MIKEFAPCKVSATFAVVPVTVGSGVIMVAILVAVVLMVVISAVMVKKKEDCKKNKVLWLKWVLPLT